MKYLITIVLLTVFVSLSGQNVKLVRDDSKQKVDITIDGNLFTSYCYPSNLEKPFLFPIYAPNGSVVTRGFPLAPRKGERVDHPHHIGLWFNHGNVNGLDFWNNSSAIPASRKDAYGHIVVQKVVKAENGQKGTLEVVSNWDNNKGKTLLTEKTKYIFSGDKTTRIIDHISVLTAAVDTVIITDNKEGMIAVRVDRAFEMPSNESLIFTDEKGNPTTVKATDNTGVTGMYVSSNGKKGDAVWGTRNEWVILTGTKDNVITSMAIFDHPRNPGFPAYSHARGYGLFAMNNLGQKSYDPKQEKKVYTLKKGESMTLYNRFYIQSGSEMTPEKAIQIFNSFSKEY
jgi:VCBS repeat-containing protein